MPTDERDSRSEVVHFRSRFAWSPVRQVMRSGNKFVAIEVTREYGSTTASRRTGTASGTSTRPHSLEYQRNQGGSPTPMLRCMWRTVHHALCCSVRLLIRSSTKKPSVALSTWSPLMQPMGFNSDGPRFFALVVALTSSPCLYSHP